MPEVTVTDLGVEYDDATALHSATFTARDGEFLTLLGPSGCGKTTTLMSIAGMVQPDRGSVRIGDRTLFDSAAGTFVQPERRNCGVVFQSYAIWPHKTVSENVEYPLALRKLDKDDRRDQVRRALDLVDMGPYAERYPHELSGGQQQRVALARAVVYEPAVLLLDEPLSNLDAKLREQARAWLKEIQARVGLTTIYVTHDQDEALALSDRIVVLDHGHIRQIGDPETVYREPADAFVADFLGSMNLLPGELVDSTDDRGTIRLDGSDGVLLGRLASELPTGSRVVLGIRREQLDFADEPADDTVEVEVMSRMFLGSGFEYHLQHGDTEFMLASPTRRDDERAHVRFPAEHCRVFSDDTEVGT